LIFLKEGFNIENILLVNFAILCFFYGPIKWALYLNKFDDRLINNEFNFLSTTNSGKNMNYGFLAFLASEVLIFAALFWVLFKTLVNPPFPIGGVWPSYLFPKINVKSIPFANTWLLTCSSTWFSYAYYRTIGCFDYFQNNQWDSRSHKIKH